MARRAIPERPAVAEVPPHLDSGARDKWAEVYPLLNDATQGTLDALEAYAVAWSQWTAAQAKVAELGPVIKSAAGFAQVSPFVTVAAQAERRMRQWHGVLHLDKPGCRKPEPESAVASILRSMKADRA